MNNNTFRFLMTLALLFAGWGALPDQQNTASQAAFLAHPAPPHPKLLEKLKQEGRSDAEIAEIFRQPDSVDQPSKAAADSAFATTGVKKAIVILVQYPNLTINPVSTPNFYRQLLFSVGSYPTGSMRDFYRENSRNLFDLQGSVIRVVTAPRQKSYYSANDGVHDKGFGPYPRSASRLVEDAILAIDSQVDFSQYAQNGVVDSLFVIHAGPGAEASGNLGDIWSHKSWLDHTLMLDGVKIAEYTIEPEYIFSAGDSTFGIFAHEYGHALGLPDFYDTTNASQGVGNWSLMSYGSWGGTPMGSSPSHLDAWSKIKLGWATPTLVQSALTNVTIPPVETSGAIYRMNGISPNEYFLVENRQQIGFDSALRAAGLLIWHVDDAQYGNTRPCVENNNWNCNGNYQLALEQADGLYELEKNITDEPGGGGGGVGEAGDPYPGSTANTTFNFTSTPNASSYYSFVDTLARVTNITASGTDIIADLSGGQVVDTTAPETSLDTYPSNPFHHQTSSFSFSGADDITSATKMQFQCNFNSVGWDMCAGGVGDQPGGGGGGGGSTFRMDYWLTPGSYTFEIRAVDLAGNVDPTPVMYAWTVVPLQIVFRSIDLHDGWLLEYSETSSLGGSKDSTSALIALGDDAQNRQYRAILSFNTAALPENPIFTKLALKLRQHSVSRVNPFAVLGKLYVDISSGPFGSLNGLQLTDFNAPVSPDATGVGVMDGHMLGDTFVTALKPNAFSFVNPNGLMQVRLAFKLDDNNDNVANLLRFYSGNASEADRPVLLVEYLLP